MPIISILPTTAKSNNQNVSSVITRASTEVLEATDAVVIPFEIETDEGLAVYHNGLLLLPETHYYVDVESSTISLNGYSARVGDVFTFVSSASVGYSATAVASNVMIADQGGNFEGLNSVEGALQYIAEHYKTNITQIQVNNVAQQPEDGRINIDLLPYSTIEYVNNAISEAIYEVLGGSY